MGQTASNLTLWQIYERFLSKWLVFFCFSCILIGIPVPANTNPDSKESPGLYDDFFSKGDIRRFNGEVLHFDISFLWFKKAASAYVRFFHENGKYHSILEAETKGIIGWFTDYRKHLYKADFEILDNNGVCCSYVS